MRRPYPGEKPMRLDRVGHEIRGVESESVAREHREALLAHRTVIGKLALEPSL
jgi:hypothetical protein